MKNPEKITQPRSTGSSGFTLIELLTVIAIIGILAAILIPVVGKVRESAKAAQCASHVRQWGMAMILYSEDNNGKYVVRGEMGADKNEGWASTNSDYYSYFDISDGFTVRNYRACVAAEVPHGQVTFVMSRPDLTPGVMAPEDAVPLGAATTPSNLLLFLDSAPQSDALGISGSQSTRAADALIGPASGYDRHGGRLNAVFGDGHLQSIKWGSPNVIDPDSYLSNFNQWMLIYQ